MRSDIYVESKQSDGYIYFLFGSQIYVVAENATMNEIHYLDFIHDLDPNMANKTGIDVDSNHFVYFLNSKIFVYWLNCYNQFELVTSVVLPSPVKDIQIRLPYFVYLT